MKTRYQQPVNPQKATTLNAIQTSGISTQAVNRFALYTVSLLLMFNLAACGGGSSSAIETPLQAEEAVQQANIATDYEKTVMTAIYSDQRTPDGFFHESLPSDDHYTLRHVKNTAQQANSVNTEAPVYEVSSDNFTEALQWSEAAANQYAAYRQLVDTAETDIYYQFTRFDPEDPVETHFDRVFKGSAVDRSGYDYDNPGSYRGMITLRPLTASNVKDVIEYLWKFTYNNNYGNSVLDSQTTETDSEFIHTMNEARLTMAAGGSCDTIKVFAIQYTVNKENGMILKDEHQVHEFQSERNGGEYRVCE